MDSRTTPPGKVSPLIKASRWGFLLVGIIYGSTRLSSLNKKESIKKAELERTRPEREAREAAEKLRRRREEEETLARQAGVELPPLSK